MDVGMMVNLLRRADLFDPALVHYRHAVGDFQRLILIVCHKHAGDVNFVMKLPQPAAQLHAHLRVQRAKGFVQQQHFRLHSQSPRQRHPLPLSAGKLRRIPVAESVELNQFQQLMHLVADFCFEGRKFRGRTRSPNAMFSNTVMCRNSA